MLNTSISQVAYCNLKSIFQVMVTVAFFSLALTSTAQNVHEHIKVYGKAHSKKIYTIKHNLETSNGEEYKKGIGHVVYINGKVRVPSDKKIVIQATDTLVIYGNLTLFENSSLINYGNLVIKGNLILGTPEHNVESIQFLNDKNANLIVEGNLIGPHPEDVHLNGKIAVCGNVDFNFHLHGIHKNEMRNNKVFYYQSNINGLAEGGNKDLKIAKLKHHKNEGTHFIEIDKKVDITESNLSNLFYYLSEETYSRVMPLIISKISSLK
ncbi:hypothetical protein EI427_03420 [Flammeovirga pectinis]|uniref:Uncharacterized protein n=1 Tax=Flammeovirga pectinis TaxID=2494373 RepID=A0A3Q9FLH1_9BACT|nr:hypothetical protein [Flammeovirga pectinis]AZQ61305.1 hypothetical protein EI427_03420 [Flammeovirga pectinis]